MKRAQPRDGFRREDLIQVSERVESGMGALYLALTPTGEMVAVKLIRAALLSRPDIRQRFTAEIAAAELVKSRYTAAIVKSDTSGKQPYFVMAYVAGPSLQEVVNAGALFDERGARALMAGLAEAFIDIHHEGLVHRDLKPGNVLLDSTGPRVIDFGISRLVNARPMTPAGHAFGSPGFMPPERYGGRRGETEKGDIWCIGAVVWYAMTGRLVDPLKGLSKHVVPADLRVLVDCLNRRPRRRPTAQELRDRLLPPGVRAEELLHSGWLPELAIREIDKRREWRDRTIREYRQRLTSARPIPRTRVRPPVAAPARRRARPFYWLMVALCLTIVIVGGWAWLSSRAPGPTQTAPSPAVPAKSALPATPAPTGTCHRSGSSERARLPYQCPVAWSNGTVPVYRTPDSSPAPFASLRSTTGDQWFRCHRRGPPYRHEDITSTWWAYTQSDSDSEWGWVPEVYLPTVRDNPRALRKCPPA